MSVLTKEDLKKLSPEQQELIASMELRLFNKRQRLLEEIRGHHDKFHQLGNAFSIVVKFLFLLAALLLNLFLVLYPISRVVFLETTFSIVLFLGIVILVFEIFTERLNKRFDASIELLELDMNMHQPQADDPHQIQLPLKVPESKR